MSNRVSTWHLHCVNSMCEYVNSMLCVTHTTVYLTPSQLCVTHTTDTLTRRIDTLTHSVDTLMHRIDIFTHRIDIFTHRIDTCVTLSRHARLLIVLKSMTPLWNTTSTTCVHYECLLTVCLLFVFTTCVHYECLLTVRLLFVFTTCVHYECLLTVCLPSVYTVSAHSVKINDTVDFLRVSQSAFSNGCGIVHDVKGL